MHVERDRLIEELRRHRPVDLDPVQEEGRRLVDVQALAERDVALDQRDLRRVLRVEVGDLPISRAAFFTESGVISG